MQFVLLKLKKSFKKEIIQVHIYSQQYIIIFIFMREKYLHLSCHILLSIIFLNRNKQKIE